MCIVGNLWGTRDLGFTDASPQWFCWCHLALKLKCAILAVFKFKHDLGFIDLCWLLCVIMVVVGDQAQGGRLSISNHHTGSTVVWCGSCFAMERLTAACVCTNLMLLEPASVWIYTLWPSGISTFPGLQVKCLKLLKTIIFWQAFKTCMSLQNCFKKFEILNFCPETFKNSGI